MHTGITDLFQGVVVIKGLPGAGKTLLAARAASELGGAAWFTFYETAERLAKYLASAGLKPPRYVFDLVSVRDKSPVDFIVEKVLSLRPDVVVVDGISALTADGERELIHAVFYHGISREMPVILIKEGVEVSPADYVADTIIEVEHRIEEGISIRNIKVLKARGRPVRYASLPYIITEEGPVVIEPREESREPPSERLATGLPGLDEALGGGLLRGSVAAVVGPPDGLASKLAAVAAINMAGRGYKVLYHHHKVVPAFLKFAETLGLDWRAQGVEWLYHPAAEHHDISWYWRSAVRTNRGGFDIHFADQYERIIAAVGADFFAEALGIYYSALERPAVTVALFNSYDAWSEAERAVAPLFDYILILRGDRVEVHAPDLATPLELRWAVDRGRKTVAFGP